MRNMASTQFWIQNDKASIMCKINEICNKVDWLIELFYATIWYHGIQINGTFYETTYGTNTRGENKIK